MSNPNHEHDLLRKVRRINPDKPLTVYTMLNDLAGDGADDVYIRFDMSQADIQNVLRAAKVCSEHGFAEVMLNWHWDNGDSVRSDLKRLEVACHSWPDRIYLQCRSFVDGTHDIQMSQEIALDCLVQQMLWAQEQSVDALYIDADDPGQFEDALALAQQSFQARNGATALAPRA
ncbi:hypothetical protein PuT2_14710 [Pusillimonas sp. T2]|uniref:hypothetical protein n=1 Tax=Pusillimonas sp. T2 TaxID=1548123 RepID=UPI000B8AAE7C|nr:hypothetical protein [Pusillimonas sp. T2]OXR48046.1 hypothetical protein PuT2_14710 [Pusillimonas sp. T2]